MTETAASLASSVTTLVSRADDAITRQRGCLFWTRAVMRYWKTYVIILTPLLLLPLIVVIDRSEARCAYVVALMAIYWTTEALPLPVTGFLPSVLYPLLGVVSSTDVCKAYFPPVNFLLMGGLIIATAIEQTNLHQRLALRVLLAMGPEPKWIMFGFMCTASFLSMWISNTATAGMMLPIALAIIEELLKSRHKEANNDTEELVERHPEKTKEKGDKHNYTDPNVFNRLPKQEQNMAKGILLSICVASNIGGTGTITGTPPNVVALGQLEKFAQLRNISSIEVNYATWMGFQVPSMLVLLLIAWIWLRLLFLGMRQFKTCCGKETSAVTAVLRKKYNEMGSMRFGERAVLVLFVALVLLWLFRDPKFMPGWQSGFKPFYIKDHIAAIFVSVLCFFIPRDTPDFWFYKSNRSRPKLRKALVTWEAMQNKFPWGVLIIMGGGLAMAQGVAESGLATMIGEFLQKSLGSVSAAVLCLVITIAVTFLTEFSSNTSTAIIFIPIMLELGVGLNVNPLYFVLPVTVSCSMAFMLPVATPPNAIMFGSNMLKVTDMMYAGFGLNILAIGVNFLNINTYGYWFYGMSEMPVWASTALVNPASA